MTLHQVTACSITMRRHTCCRLRRWIPNLHRHSLSDAQAFKFITQKVQFGNLVGNSEAAFCSELRTPIDVTATSGGLIWELSYSEIRYRFEVSRQCLEALVMCGACHMHFMASLFVAGMEAHFAEGSD